MKRSLARTDLAAGDPCKQVDCQACISNPGVGGGLLHQRSGALYRGTCKLCAAVGRSTVYHGESGYNGYTRLDDHGGDIKAGNLSNAFAKHLTEDHPEATAMEIQTAIKFEVLRTFEKTFGAPGSRGSGHPKLQGGPGAKQQGRVGAACCGKTDRDKRTP